MATRRSSKKTAGSAGKRGVRSLPAKTLKGDQAKRVKGGRIGNIKGESLDPKHPDTIHIET
jgi:hypothetical protein